MLNLGMRRIVMRRTGWGLSRKSKSQSGCVRSPCPISEGGSDARAVGLSLTGLPPVVPRIVDLKVFSSFRISQETIMSPKAPPNGDAGLKAFSKSDCDLIGDELRSPMEIGICTLAGMFLMVFL